MQPTMANSGPATTAPGLQNTSVHHMTAALHAMFLCYKKHAVFLPSTLYLTGLVLLSASMVCSAETEFRS